MVLPYLWHIIATKAPVGANDCGPHGYEDGSDEDDSDSFHNDEDDGEAEW